MSNKVSLRKHYADLRMKLSAEEILHLSEKLCNVFFESIELGQVSTLHLFLSIQEKKEVNTAVLIKRLEQEFPHVQLAVPKLDRSGSGEMRSLVWDSSMPLEANKWGIPEPVEELQVADTEIDLVLVPLLVADRQGNRIGYGKGFYDQFFKRCKPTVVKCGLSLFELEEQVIATDPWDVPLDLCITPSGLKVFNL